jgi:hypothetical protein
LHIVEEHSGLAGLLESVLEAVESAEWVYAGNAGECLAAKAVAAGKYLVVVYRETDAADGLVITAFLTRRLDYLARRTLLWP